MSADTPLPDYERPALYIHVPFCSSFCAYCDFCSVLTPSSGGPERYLARLEEDLDALWKGEESRLISTVFLGGGTPSALGSRGLGGVLEALARRVQALEEISVELNPESLDDDLIDTLLSFNRSARSRGVLAPDGRLRLSLGVQSLCDDARQAVSRAGSAAMVRQRLAALFSKLPAAGGGVEVSADLMAGLPHQPVFSLVSDIEELSSLGMAHFSLYALTLEEGTPLARDVAAGRCRIGDDDAIAEQLEAARGALSGAGFCQYEVSNYARPGCECRHNLRYWHMADWLALGPSAVGTIFDRASGTALRTTQTADVGAWLEGAQEALSERVGRRDALFEFIMMGFRLACGPDMREFRRRFGKPLEAFIPRSLDAWASRGLLERRAAGPFSAALRPEGLMFLNRFLVDCLNELEGPGVPPAGSPAGEG